MSEIDLVLEAILAAFEKSLHRIGTTLVGDARDEALRLGIRDRGDFERQIDYRVDVFKTKMNLRLGSRVKHGKFVLGGKVPSWTPFAPIRSWVDRHQNYFEFTRKDGDRDKEIKSIAWGIVHKIKKEGIKERNIFATVIKNRQEWIFDELDNVSVIL